MIILGATAENENEKCPVACVGTNDGGLFGCVVVVQGTNWKVCYVKKGMEEQ